MIEHPLLCKDAMVKSILNTVNPKTNTRRVCRDQGEGLKFQYVVDNPTYPERWKGKEAKTYTGWVVKYPNLDLWLPRKCPYGQPGDRLWVRETWRFDDRHTIRSNDLTCHIKYAADDAVKFFGIPEGSIKRDKSYECGIWRPAIHLPRWACRILLEVLSVRVERLQDITEQDAIAEGMPSNWSGDLAGWNAEEHGYIAPHLLEDPDDPPDPYYATAIDAFRQYWDFINAGRGFGWDTNPFVWVIQFRRIA